MPPPDTASELRMTPEEAQRFALQEKGERAFDQREAALHVNELNPEFVDSVEKDQAEIDGALARIKKNTNDLRAAFGPIEVDVTSELGGVRKDSRLPDLREFVAWLKEGSLQERAAETINRQNPDLKPRIAEARAHNIVRKVEHIVTLREKILNLLGPSNKEDELSDEQLGNRKMIVFRTAERIATKVARY